MNNSQFLDILKESFIRYLETHSNSTEKLKILHGAVSADLSKMLKTKNDTVDVFDVFSLGFANGKEKEIAGRYIEKRVDITVNKNGTPTAGISIKFAMSNYKQNSNNYFENMLGETANIRCNNIPYFQIFIIPDKIPYYKDSGKIKGWECINKQNLKKYIKLSEDNPDVYTHTPDKTLVFIVNITGDENPVYQNKTEYKNFYLNNDFTLRLSDKTFEFKSNVVYNDYEKFINKIVHRILNQ